METFGKNYNAGKDHARDGNSYKLFVLNVQLKMNESE